MKPQRELLCRWLEQELDVKIGVAKDGRFSWIMDSPFYDHKTMKHING